MGVYDGAQRSVADKDPTQDIQWDIQKIAQAIGQGLTTLITNFIETAINAVQETIKEVIDLLVGFVTNPLESLSKLGEWARQLLPLDIFQSLIGLAGSLNPLTFLSWFKNLIFGFDRVPIGNLTDEQPELLLNPKFSGLGSIESNEVWVWDQLVGHTEPGAAKVTANGDRLAPLYSNPINVAAGQKLQPLVWTIWDELVATGSPIRLGVAEYRDASLLNVELIDEITSPGMSTGTWQGLSGSYTVPAGVDNVRLQLSVLETATAGEIWFDDASTKRVGTIPQSWVGGLVEKWDQLFAIFGGTIEGLQQFVKFVFKLFNLENIFDIFHLDFDTFNPFTFWQEVIVKFLNPLQLLRDSGLRDLVQGLIDAFLEVLEGVPIIGGTLARLFEKFLHLKTTNDISVTDANPPIVAQAGRIDALDAKITDGTEGFMDHLNREDLGGDWLTVSGCETPDLYDSRYAYGNLNRAAAYYAPAGVAFEFNTDVWHLQASVQGLIDQSTHGGISKLWVGSASMGNHVGVRLQYPGAFDPDVNIGIVTGTSSATSTPQGTRFDVDKSVIKDEDVIALRRTYDSLSGKYTFSLYFNNTLKDSWTDTGGIVTAGVGFRKPGFMINAEGFTTSKGLGWDDLSGHDIIA